MIGGYITKQQDQANTYPSADHSNPPNNFLYVEASGFANETAILNTCHAIYDFTNLLAPKFSFLLPYVWCNYGRITCRYFSWMSLDYGHNANCYWKSRRSMEFSKEISKQLMQEALSNF